jgi:hypothetical protein
MASHGCQGLPGQRLGSAKRGHIRPSRLIQRHRWRLLAHSATAFWSTEGSRGLRAACVAPCGSRAGAATGFDVTCPGNPAGRPSRTASPLNPSRHPGTSSAARLPPRPFPKSPQDLASLTVLSHDLSVHGGTDMSGLEFRRSRRGFCGQCASTEPSGLPRKACSSPRSRWLLTGR